MSRREGCGEASGVYPFFCSLARSLARRVCEIEKERYISRGRICMRRNIQICGEGTKVFLPIFAPPPRKGGPTICCGKTSIGNLFIADVTTSEQHLHLPERLLQPGPGERRDGKVWDVRSEEILFNAVGEKVSLLLEALLHRESVDSLVASVWRGSG